LQIDNLTGRTGFTIVDHINLTFESNIKGSLPLWFISNNSIRFWSLAAINELPTERECLTKLIMHDLAFLVDKLNFKLQ